MSIDVLRVTKNFGDFRAVDNASFKAHTGELVALLGPSGSGKTSLLRIIAGLELPDSGTVHFHDDDVTFRATRERNVGFVFQHYALFRHMTVFENVAFGLRVRKVPRAQADERVRELLQLAQLSGGQRQRVALARALAPEPKLLLLDEPFGSLDAKVRTELRAWLRRLHDEIRTTSVFVTHDQEEAFAVADRVVIIDRGKVQQVGSPESIRRAPANAFVADFIGIQLRATGER
jgi:sulfate transport system ATP-binding protein